MSAKTKQLARARKAQKLALNKETIKDLTAKNSGQVNGGANATGKFSCYRPYCA